MNVVILTPDGVGSTLLQRTLTVQMLMSDFDKPVVNLHELTNGLTSYYSPELGRMILGKDFKLIYSQPLTKIVELLESHDHYKTSRLAHYHLIRRQDSLNDQHTLYRHLNNNFFIIIAKRRNLLDYGLSWALRNIHKQINVYSTSEKVYNFLDLYKDPVTVDTARLLSHLNDYKNFLDWAELNFDIGSEFIYEDHTSNLENYMLSLPVFAGRKKKQWEKEFNISFNDFNKCHKSVSDIGSIALNKPADVKLLTYDNTENKSLEDTIISHLPVTTQLHLQTHRENYNRTHKAIGHLVKIGLLVGNLPIKKHTFEEKRLAIKNFNECVSVYNDWIQNYPNLGQPIDDGKIKLTFESEQSIWSTKE